VAGIEIERKWLVKEIPIDLERYQSDPIRQGYILSTDDYSVRVRSKGNNLFLTIKSGSGLSRREIEEGIDVDLFDRLWPSTQGQRIVKTRYLIPYSEASKTYTIELDIFKQALKGMVLAEVEFKDEQSAKSFVPPEWLGQEVTDLPGFTNAQLALYGIPKGFEELACPKIEVLGQYDLEDGLQEILTRINTLLSNTRPVIVLIAGGSASGKTSQITDKLTQVLGDECCVLKMDDYYYGKSYMEEQRKNGMDLNWDQPEALNLERLAKDLSKLRECEEVSKPIYDFSISEPVDNEVISPKSVIIIEGLFALNEMLADFGHLKVFIDIGFHGRLIRRIIRDVDRKGHLPGDILGYMTDVVEPMHVKYIQPTKDLADIVIVNELSPPEESKRCWGEENQLKFALPSESKNPPFRWGAALSGTTHQNDWYLTPQDRDLGESDEIVRLRWEGEKVFFTYKGPRSEGLLRTRRKIEFQISPKTASSFMALYRKKPTQVSKFRTFFHLNGILFSLDQVTLKIGKEAIALGEFIEFRISPAMLKSPEFEKVLKILGLDQADAIRRPYIELAPKD